MLKRKSKKPNIFWYTFSLETWACPKLFLDFGRSKESRNGDHHNRGDNFFNYDKDEFWFRIGSSLISDNVLEIMFTPNQHEYLKYLHQEWSGPKTFIKGALLK